MIAGEYFSSQMHLATVVAPVAVYFLILGLLNSRKHPQLITGRQDIVLLAAALSPALILPLADYLGGPALAMLAVGLAALAVGVLARGTSSGSYVVYNLTHKQAQQALERALRGLNIRYDCQGRRISLPDHDAYLEVSSFALLRNVSIRMRQGDPQLCRRLAAQLGGVLGGIEAQTSSMAVGLLIVATALLLAPLVTVVHRAPEIVRILTDLLH
jgi:hypothetical protein